MVTMNKKLLLIIGIVLVFLIKKPACYFPEEEITVKESTEEIIIETQQFLEENKVIEQFHTGMSMFPFIKPNQICLCETSEVYKINDVIVFYDYYDKLYFISHRIIDKVPSGFITKGDNNEKADSQIVSGEQIFCKIKEESLFERLI